MSVTKANTTPRIMACPTCKKSIEWSDKYPERPFCSKRCQQIDFGDWAEERNVIAGADLTSGEGVDEFDEWD